MTRKLFIFGAMLPLLLGGAAVVCAQSQPVTQNSPATQQSQSTIPPQTPPNQNSSQSCQQNDSQSNAGSDDSDSTPVTLFPHSGTSRWWISGQANIVLQGHPTFPAQYTGPNSLSAPAQSATTHILTLYTGFALTHTTEIFADPEFATGGGVGGAVGLAGYSNLDAVRTVQGVALAEKPYFARLMIRQIIPLSKEMVNEDRDELHLATSVPVRRFEVRLGKFSLVDFFDNNTWGSDSHLQFLNWTVDDNGAYDYAANTRGYTDGLIVEYYDHWFAARYGLTLEPKEANGNFLDADLARARAENVELQATGKLIAHQTGTVRLLGFWNTADMGNYREAIGEFLSGEVAGAPNIVDTRVQGRHKYGTGLSFEQVITPRIGVFGRFGWDDGHTESWAYTEVDNTVEVGVNAPGRSWHRNHDSAGFAFVSNGIAKDHAQYLMLGGMGFLLGDGNLTYGRETIEEAYFNVHFWRGLFGAFDLQHINNPGYNQARGPVLMPGLRAHVDF